jgi:hypothetical protein
MSSEAGARVTSLGAVWLGEIHPSNLSFIHPPEVASRVPFAGLGLADDRLVGSCCRWDHVCVAFMEALWETGGLTPAEILMTVCRAAM